MGNLPAADSVLHHGHGYVSPGNFHVVSSKVYVMKPQPAVGTKASQHLGVGFTSAVQFSSNYCSARVLSSRRRVLSTRLRELSTRAEL